MSEYTEAVKKVAKKKRIADYDLNSPEAVELFREAAKVFTARIIKSHELTLKTLISEGIYTKSGKLSKNYR